MKQVIGIVLLCVSGWVMAEDVRYEKAVFAGGCFWCMEPPFDKLDGVVETLSGYAGGKEKNPNYKQVSQGKTGHAEVVQITYDPSKVSYEKLLQVFWVNVDPLDNGGQFCDRGAHYRTGIFPLNDEQRLAAEKSIQALDASGRLPKKVVTEIELGANFYAAEDYHQNYYQRNPIRYKFYRNGCRRDKRLDEVWGEERSLYGQ